GSIESLKSCSCGTWPEERLALQRLLAQRPARKAYSTESKCFVKAFFFRRASDACRTQEKAKRA
ncbi:hypothetical protein, partial [uncultured Halomonas sp.]|uniref:hypothetical protein n=1 Tax=uncultured Halomonas sp. TaxID=173971 RepID=UPI002599D006